LSALLVSGTRREEHRVAGLGGADVLAPGRSVLVVGAGTRPRDAVLDGDNVAVLVGLCLAVGNVRDEHPALGRHAELEALELGAKLVAPALFGRVDTVFRSAGFC